VLGKGGLSVWEGAFIAYLVWLWQGALGRILRALEKCLFPGDGFFSRSTFSWVLEVAGGMQVDRVRKAGWFLPAHSCFSVLVDELPCFSAWP